MSASSSLCFTSISFLHVVGQHPSLFVPDFFYPHLPLHPNLQHPQRPWQGVAETAQAHPLQTQVMSPTPPTSSAIWTRSTRRSPPRFPVPRRRYRDLQQIQKVCRTQEHPAAARAEFPQCSDLQASRNRWQVMCRVDQASRKLERFRTENLLQQRF